MMNRHYLTDGVIELRLNAVERNDWLFPLVYFYDIYEYQGKTKVGKCDFRRQKNIENYYAGNIGYMILPPYRGRGYAYLAACLLCKLASGLRVRSFYITCSPENTASYRTIVKLGAEYLERAIVPKEHYLHRQGEQVKDIFIMRLNGKNSEELTG